MNDFIIMNEPMVRLAVFFGVFVVMAAWELIVPRRKLTASKLKRWSGNIGIIVFNTILIRVLFPTAAVGLAIFAQSEGWGIFNYFETSAWVAILVSIIVMDFIIYLQHIMFHAVPTLWRVHKMHHADLDLDVTSGTRFHPIEILISLVVKFSAVILLGAPVLAVVLFEIILNATAMFNHGNVKVPLGIDKVLRWLVVTPDMHRVHHSIEIKETNRNFGFNLPWWDRLFGTYKAQPDKGHEGMVIGLKELREEDVSSRLGGMLVIPFLRKKK